MSNEQYTAIPIYSISPDEPLPFAILIRYAGRFIKYRAAGEALDTGRYNRLIFKQITELYIQTSDVTAYRVHCDRKQAVVHARLNDPTLTSEQRLALQTVFDVEGVTKELFSSKNLILLNKSLYRATQVAKTSVEIVCARPYLRIFDWVPIDSQAVITHSVRTSLLAVFLAYQFGHVNPLVLENLAAAGVLHDIGKTRVVLPDDLEAADVTEEEIMKDHPMAAAEVLRGSPDVTAETVQIIMEHHEYHDGSGYPHGLRGAKLDRLSRIFNIANGYDNLLSFVQGTPEQRNEEVLTLMKTKYRKRFDPELLPRALRILAMK